MVNVQPNPAPWGVIHPVMCGSVPAPAVRYGLIRSFDQLRT
ncbi:hypothetical protein HDA32_001918 [Spinactinospora alkalitolerans]|uniref:Uncharacterized protein n=1 Tax=Spinactinospora alkalitolerans TaxID=687207 RepID=A0A852TS71_9ACTN|nr:hypothetical protein [Spinactinospora alkalitolerans]